MIITVPGDALTERKRQRFNRRKDGGLVPGARTDEPSRADWKAQVRHEARLVCKEPLQGPLSLTITVRRVRPASYPKRPTKTCPWPFAWTRKPDLDNFVKPIQDALTGIAWIDDAQVTDLTVRKRFGPRAETVIEVAQTECVWHQTDQEMGEAA